MPKYYVQSGTLQLITTASDSRAAAIWAVHRALAPTLPFLCENSEPGLAVPTRATRIPYLHDTVQVSEQGFDRCNSEQFATLAVIAEWNQLLVAIDRIERRMADG
jgi:hypothetical protein